MTPVTSDFKELEQSKNNTSLLQNVARNQKAYRIIKEVKRKKEKEKLRFQLQMAVASICDANDKSLQLAASIT